MSEQSELKVGDVIQYDRYEGTVIGKVSDDSTIFILCEHSGCILYENVIKAYGIDPKFIGRKYWTVSSGSVQFKYRPKSSRHTDCQVCNHS